MKNSFLLLLFIVLLGSSCGFNLPLDQETSFVSDNKPELTTQEVILEDNVTVKYLDTKVNVADPRFEYLDTSKSSFVRGAWYDSDDQYMIINVSGTNYQYCSLPERVWSGFKIAPSFGKYYNANIKNLFDCRYN